VIEALRDSDGVMIGREAYHRPWLLSDLQQALYPADSWSTPDAAAVLEAMGRYASRECEAGTPLSAITRHMLGLLAGRPGARDYRHLMSVGSRGGVTASGLFTRAAQLLRNREDEERVEGTA
jgi:tRNA-dihydrouridine synthase A